MKLQYASQKQWFCSQSCHYDMFLPLRWAIDIWVSFHQNCDLRRCTDLQGKTLILQYTLQKRWLCLHFGAQSASVKPSPTINTCQHVLCVALKIIGFLMKSATISPAFLSKSIKSIEIYNVFIKKVITSRVKWKFCFIRISTPL